MHLLLLLLLVQVLLLLVQVQVVTCKLVLVLRVLLVRVVRVMVRLRLLVQGSLRLLAHRTTGGCGKGVNGMVHYAQIQFNVLTRASFLSSIAFANPQSPTQPYTITCFSMNEWRNIELN